MVNEYEQRFNTILEMNNTSTDKDRMLARLMTDMEQAFQIPMTKNKAWEEKNPQVYSVYRKISDSRSL